MGHVAKHRCVGKVRYMDYEEQAIRERRCRKKATQGGLCRECVKRKAKENHPDAG